MCILVSIFSVVAISFQRFLNINSPMSGQINKSSNPRTLLIIIFIWIASILLALPLAIWRVYRERLWMDWDEVNTLVNSLTVQFCYNFICVL